MKRLFPILALIVLSFAACKKENAAKGEFGGPDPIPPRLISTDTLSSGAFWGIAIGENSADIYTKIQAMRIERNIGGMGIVNNVYTDIEALESKIPLYTSIFLDEAKGTGTGIQIGFADDKVKTIFTNDGVQLNYWPLINSADAAVAVGTPINKLYQKLVNIKKQAAYAKKFERISIFSKDVNKAYDPQMSASPQWYFASVITDTRYNRVILNFTAGKLVSIYSTVYESK